MNQSFLFFELIGIFIVHWLILEPQTYVVVEQFEAENIPLVSGRLVYYCQRENFQLIIIYFIKSFGLAVNTFSDMKTATWTKVRVRY